MTAPSSAPLAVTTGTTTSTTDLPYTQLYSLGDQGFKADVGANAHQLSGSASPTATSVTISLGSLSPEGNILYDAKSATVVIANGATAQNITDAHLQFTDTVGGQTVTIDYPCAGVGQWSWGYYGSHAGVTLGSPMSIAQNSYQSFSFPLEKGILANAQLVLTYASAPSAGTASAKVVLSATEIQSYSIKPMLLFSASSSALTASANFIVTANGAFNRNASTRSLHFVNNFTGQNSAGIYVWSYDSVVIPSSFGGSIGTSTQAFTNLNNADFQSFSDSYYSANAQTFKRFADVVDSVAIQVMWGSTAASSGSFDVYMSQQFR